MAKDKDNREQEPEQAAAPDPATFPRRRSTVLPRLRPTNLKKFSKVLLRLGTSEDAVAALPQITPYITQTLKLQRDQVLQFLRMSEDPAVQRWLAIFDREDLLESVRQIIPYECICAAAGVSPNKILETLGGMIIRSGSQEAALKAARMLPEVVDATIGYAMTEGGIADRTNLFKATNFLPQPKGAQTTINVMANASAQAAAAVQQTYEAPKPESTIRGLVDAFHEARTGEAAIRVPMPALTEGDEDAEYVPDEMPRQQREPVPTVINAQTPAQAMQSMAFEKEEE